MEIKEIFAEANYGHRAFVGNLCVVFWYSDLGTFPGEATASGGIYLCGVRKGGVLSTAGSEHSESGYCAGVHELF